MIKKLILSLLIVVGFLTVSAPALAHNEAGETTVPIYLFGREDCHFCQAEKTFLEEQGVNYLFLDVVNDETAKEYFDQVVEKHNLSKVTPVSVVGSFVIQGFNSGETTGARLLEAVESAETGEITTLDEHLKLAPAQTVVAGKGCDENGTECDIAAGALYVFDLPLVGVVDLRQLSLFSLAAILGTVDGFNPCAMWVLITFLVLLSQAGSRRKMIFLAGLFIFAEAIMYNLILNVWYKTWDFVALDQIVTPLVGILALGGGTFFLWRWYKNRNLALVCDISDIESQSRTVDRFKAVINQPVTITTILAIIAIAFSVNIIEFACSIGIPQAFTKILELNSLNFLERQFYILVYTVGYMLDDVVVFALAVWGYSKLEAHGHKYSQLSLLIGGALMLLLGGLLVFAPKLLVL